MKILITGVRGLADALRDAYIDHEVTSVSKSGGFDIHNVDHWGTEFLDCDIVFNCAYDGFGQVSVVEFFFKHWKNDPSKTIVSIGSRAITHKRIENTDEYWPYRTHKLALQSVHDSMLLSAKCDLKIFNPGPIDTHMISHLDCTKADPVKLAQQIKQTVADPTVKRVDLWVQTGNFTIGTQNQVPFVLYNALDVLEQSIPTHPGLTKT